VVKRPKKITFAELRAQGVRGLLDYCADYHCSHHIAITAIDGWMRWLDEMRLSDLEPHFVCTASGRRGADIRPDFHWDKPGLLTTGF
jgi:hypothetical protein